MPDWGYAKSREGGLRAAVSGLTLAAVLVTLLGPGSKSSVVFYILITILNFALSTLILLRHLNDDLATPLFNLPWKKAEIFIYYGAGALTLVGCVICWSNSDSKIMSMGAVLALVAAVIEMAIATKVRGLPNEILVRADKAEAEEKKDTDDPEAQKDGENKAENGDSDEDSPERLDKLATLESHITVDSAAGLVNNDGRNNSSSTRSSSSAKPKIENGAPAARPSQLSKNSNQSITSSIANNGENKEIFDHLHGQHVTNGEQTIKDRDKEAPSSGSTSNRRNLRYFNNNSVHSGANSPYKSNSLNPVDSVLNRQPLSHMTHHSISEEAPTAKAKVEDQLKLGGHENPVFDLSELRPSSGSKPITFKLPSVSDEDGG